MKLKNIFSHFVILSLFVFVCLAFKMSPNDNRDNRDLILTGSPALSFSPLENINGLGSVAGTWANLMPSPNTNSRCFPALIMRNDTAHIFQFGGGTSANQLRSVARYNTRTGTWSTTALNNAPLALMPFGVSSGSAIAYNDTAIYVFGGDNAAGLGRSMKYSVRTNTWTNLAEMPTLLTDQATVLWKNTDIFLIGGSSGVFAPVPTTVHNTIQKYNIASNSWSTAGTYPVSCGMQGCGIIGDTVIVAGGFNGTVAIGNAYKGIINETGTNISWTPIGNYPGAPDGITRMGSGFIKRGNAGGVLFTGGALGGNTATDATYIWDFCSQKWDTVAANLPLARCNFKCASRGDSIIYAVSGYTTDGVGNTEKLTITSMEGSCFLITDITPVSEIISDYKLSQNYPNPFNPATKINFSIPKQGFTTLKVYNVLGKEIATLINGLKNQGNYSVEFNAVNLASGIYFYRLEVNGFIEVKRMTLIK